MKQDAAFRIGTGYDSHRFVSGRPLILGGVEIPHSRGLQGHSDADVLIHAIIDAVFGALGDGNIGTHFPDTDPQYKGISSLTLLSRTGERLRAGGYELVNLDSTVIMEEPKLSPHVSSIRNCLAKALETDVSAISVKAKTNEGMGFVGRREGVVALATVLVARHHPPASLP